MSTESSRSFTVPMRVIEAVAVSMRGELPFEQVAPERGDPLTLLTALLQRGDGSTVHVRASLHRAVELRLHELCDGDRVRVVGYLAPVRPPMVGLSSIAVLELAKLGVLTRAAERASTLASQPHSSPPLPQSDPHTSFGRELALLEAEQHNPLRRERVCN